MRNWKICTLFILLCGFATLASAQPALVASTSFGSNSANPTSSAINTTGATLLVVNVSRASNNTSILSDSYNNTWAQAVAEFSVAFETGTMFYAVNPIVGTGHTFSWSNSGPAVAMEIAAFSGVTGVAPVDAITSAGGNVNSIQPGSITPSASNTLLVAGLGWECCSSLTSINSGFTIVATNNGVNNVNAGGSMAYLVQSSPAAVNPTWSIGGTSWTSTRMVAFLAGNATPPTSISLLSSAKVVGSSGTSSGINTSGASLLVANVSAYANTSGSVSDSKGNTWSYTTAQCNNNMCNKIAYAVNPTVGTGHTFTLSGGNLGGLIVGAFSGIKTSSPYASDGGGNGATGTFFSAGTATPSSMPNLFVAGYTFQNNSGSAYRGIDLGFKTIDSQVVGGSQVGAAMAWMAQSATTARAPTWSQWTGGNWGSNIINFSGVVAGSPGTNHHVRSE